MRLGDLDIAEKAIEDDLNIEAGARYMALTDVIEVPTIDPETIPVVRQLREELARVAEERDAAVKDLETIMEYGGENLDTCKFCKNVKCYARGGTKLCIPKWRCPQKEE